MSTSQPGEPRARLGVLFVHGIGNQPQGDTLVSMGESLYHWLRKWGDHSVHRRVRTARFDADLVEADLVDPPKDAPPHARLRITVEGSAQPVEWLLVEAWWAHSFHRSSLSNVLSWGLSIGPWAAITHFATSIERLGYREWGKPSRLPVLVLGSVWSLIQALFLSLGVTFVGLTVVVLAVVPIPGFRAIAERIREWLADSIGDSRQLTQHDFEYQAMARQVTRALDWMRPQVDRAAVVAHSQGAAVAERALAGWSGGDVSLLITFGSGRNKLESLREQSLLGSLILGVAVAVGVVLAPFFLGTAISLIAGRPVPALGGITVYVFVMVGFLLFFGISGSLKRAREAAEAKISTPGAVERWHDYFGSRDPISNGPLGRNLSRGVQSVPVWNRDSALYDHTTYWRAEDGFVALVSRDLASTASPPGLFTRRDVNAIGQFAARRRWRFLVGRRMGWVGTAGVILALIALVPNAARIGEFAMRTVTSWFDRLPPEFGAITSIVRSAASAVPDVAVGLGLIIVGWSAIGLLRRIPWAAWEGSDQIRFLQRLGPTDGLGYASSALVLESLLLAGGIALVVRSRLGPPEFDPGIAAADGFVMFVFVGWIAGVVLNRLFPGPPGVTAWMWAWWVFAPVLSVLVGLIFSGLGSNVLDPTLSVNESEIGRSLLIRALTAMAAMMVAWSVVASWPRWIGRFAAIEASAAAAPEQPVRSREKSPWQLRTDSALVCVAGLALLILAAFQPKDPLFIWVYWMGGWLLAGRGLVAEGLTGPDLMLSRVGGIAAAVSILLFWNPLRWPLGF